MLARRLLMFALILLVVTTISSALAPPPRTTSSPPPAASEGSAAAGAGAVVERTVEAEGGKAPDVAVQAGDILRLTVEAREAGAVELEGLGGLRAIAPETPVLFDVRPRRAGGHPVVFTPAGGAARTVATVRVVSPER